MIAGFVGFVAVIPAALIQVTIGSTGTLLYAALVFGYALFASTFLAADVVAREQPDEDEIVELHSPTVIGASIVMMMLRAVVGFMLFLMAFWLRTQSAGTAKFGLALSTAAIATVIGNASASRLRRMLSEEQMLLGALVMSGTAGFTAAMLGGIPAMIVLAFFANLAASIGRLGFESDAAARRAGCQPRSGVRNVRDPVPALVGRGRPDPGRRRDVRADRRARDRPVVRRRRDLHPDASPARRTTGNDASPPPDRGHQVPAPPACGHEDHSSSAD